MIDLTMDQKKLLYLISKKGRVNEVNGNIIWLKELSLQTLVFVGISRRILKSYDYAPSLVNFRGVKLYANISQEYILAIDLLIRLNLVNKLKMNTKYYDNITAYSVTLKGMAVLTDLSDDLKIEINELMKCPKCDQDIKVRVEGRKSYLVCPECDHRVETGFFTIENIPYHATAFFSGGGR